MSRHALLLSLLPALQACGSDEDTKTATMKVGPADCSNLLDPKVYGTSDTGDSCTSTDECCGFCNTSNTCMCYQVDTPCTVGRDCCSNLCRVPSDGPGKCQCTSSGFRCQIDSDCCESQCVDGVCS